jgi:photosystem II stability/assembly factor-like uncharacterized protein
MASFLIAGAQRRRAGYAAAALLALGLGVWLLLGRGSGGAVPGRGPRLSAAQELRALERAALRPYIGEAGVEPSGAGWAMNGLGLWLTSDGGTHWRVTSPSVPGGDVVARVCQVELVDRRHGWISGCDLIGNRIYGGGSDRYAAIERTTDGGRTWRVSAPNCPACGGSLSFLDARRGFALGSNGVYASSDGGLTWRFVAHAPFRGSIEFLDADRGFALTWSGHLYRTTDGGRTWRRLPFDALGLPRFGVVATDGTVESTGDGGETWTAVRAPRAGRFARFSAATARDWFLWSGRALWRTTDAGKDWSRIRMRVVPKQLWDLTFTSPSTGWAIFGIGEGAALARTTNAGRDWLPLAPPVRRR